MAWYESSNDEYIWESDEDFEKRIAEMIFQRSVNKDVRLEIAHKEKELEDKEQQILDRMFADCREDGGIYGRHEMYLSARSLHKTEDGVISITESYCRNCGAILTRNDDTGQSTWRVGKRIYAFNVDMLGMKN